jgi:hypothetical protein
MKPDARFGVALIVAGVLVAALVGLTVVFPTWVEQISSWDPDNGICLSLSVGNPLTSAVVGSGSFEVGLALVVGVAVAVAAALAYKGGWLSGQVSGTGSTAPP